MVGGCFSTPISIELYIEINNAILVDLDKSIYLTIVNVYLAIRSSQSVLAHARVARDTVHAGGARRARVLLTFVYIC